MNQFFVKSLMTTCNKLLASFFSSLVLSCLCICPAAEAYYTNTYGDICWTYDELDQFWGDFYEDYTGEQWPGMQGYLNGPASIYLNNFFKDPKPIPLGQYKHVDYFASETNNWGMATWATLDPERNALFHSDGPESIYDPQLVPLDTSIPTLDMLAVADGYNLVNPVVTNLYDSRNLLQDKTFPYNLRYGFVSNLHAQIRYTISAPLFRGVYLQFKSYPFPWAGYWSDRYISCTELWSNGVDVERWPSYYYTNTAIFWLTTNRSIYGSFSNITVKVRHLWNGE